MNLITNKKNIKNYEIGASSLLMVLIVMALGLFMLMSNKTQTTEYMKLLRQEVQFINETNRSYSALNWGMSLEWNIENNDELDNWKCEFEARLQLESCLKKSSRDDVYLLRSVALPINNFSKTIFKFVTLNEVDLNQFHLNPLPRGWSDLCPERNERFCDAN